MFAKQQQSLAALAETVLISTTTTTKCNETFEMEIAQGLFLHCALHCTFFAIPRRKRREKETVKLCTISFEFLIQFPWMQSNNTSREMRTEWRIAYAQIGRKLFSCTDDNVAFRRSGVISLREIWNCATMVFSLRLLIHIITSLMGGCLCVFDIHCLLRWWCKMETSLANIFLKR